MIDYEELAEMLKALSDPNRLMIVEMLSGENSAPASCWSVSE